MVKDVLYWLETYIQKEFRCDDFAFKNKDKFIENISQKTPTADQKNNQSINYDILNKEASALFEILDTTIYQSGQTISFEVAQRIKTLIAKTMKESNKIGDEARRLKWLFDFYQKMGTYFDKLPHLTESLKMRGIQDFIGLDYDEKNGKVINRLYEKSRSKREFLANIQHDIQILDKQNSTRTEKSKQQIKVSFDEFINSQELLDKF